VVELEDSVTESYVRVRVRTIRDPIGGVRYVVDSSSCASRRSAMSSASGRSIEAGGLAQTNPIRADPAAVSKLASHAARARSTKLIAAISSVSVRRIAKR